MVAQRIVRFVQTIVILSIIYGQVEATSSVSYAKESRTKFYPSPFDYIPQEAFVLDDRYEQYLAKQDRVYERTFNNSVGPEGDTYGLNGKTDRLKILVTGGYGFVGE